MRIILLRLFSILMLMPVSGCADAGQYNGFDVSGSLVPVSQIHQGGTPRDGIPSLDDPNFVSAAEAGFLEPGARVLGIAIGGQSRAYPVAIMNWHEIVNDRVAGRYLLVTYCPLCGSGMAFNSNAFHPDALVYEHTAVTD